MKKFLVSIIICILAIYCSSSAHGLIKTWTAGQNDVQSLFKNGKYLWAGTSGSGALKWNLDDYSYEQFTTNNDLSDNVVNDLAIDFNVIIWMATNSAVFKLTFLSWKMKREKLDAHVEFLLNENILQNKIKHPWKYH